MQYKIALNNVIVKINEINMKIRINLMIISKTRNNKIKKLNKILKSNNVKQNKI
jgi:hypothetical protein